MAQNTRTGAHRAPATPPTSSTGLRRQNLDRRGASPDPRHGFQPSRQAGCQQGRLQESQRCTRQDIPQDARRQGARVAALDGMRALAILSIVAYHLNLAFLPSGHMGVVMFLVLTGYLLANSIAREFSRRGTVGLGRLWARRFMRIWPAMAAAVVVVAVLCIAFDHVLFTKMRPNIVPSLLFFANWYDVLSGSSYFDQIGGPSPVTHLWYVSLDAQLVVALSALLFVAFKLGASRVAARRACLAAALVSAAVMGVLFDPSSDPSRVYYGTDTRAFAVFVGAWFALAWPLGGRPDFGAGLFFEPAPAGGRAADQPRPAFAGNVLGVVALALLVGTMALVPASSPFFYYGGMLLVAFLTVALMAALMTPGNWMARLLGLRPLAWLGERSYGVYLWHYPLICLLGAAGGAWWLQLLAAVLSVAMAEVSWVLVEKPLASSDVLASLSSLRSRPTDRRRDAGPVAVGNAQAIKPSAARAAHARTRTPQPRKAPLSARDVAVPGTLLVLAVVAAVGCFVVPEKTLVPREAIQSTGESVSHGMDLETLAAQRAEREGAQTGAGDAGQPAVSDAAEGDGAGDAAGAPYVPEGDIVVRTSPATAELYYNPVLIGDSVPGDTPFYEFFPNGLSDAYASRRPSDALGVLYDYLAEDIVGDVVIFACFSNTTPWPDELDEVAAAVGPDRRLYLVGTVNPEGFQDQANANLVDCALRHDNVYYIDWPAHCAGNEDAYLYDDGTHLTEEGAWAYMRMVAHAVVGDILAAGGSVSAM